MYAASDWYHISTMPPGVADSIITRVVHYLDPVKLVEHAREIIAAGEPNVDEAVATTIGCYSIAIRAELGFPEDWIAVPGWAATVAPGRPDKLIELVGLSDGLPELNCSH